MSQFNFASRQKSYNACKTSCQGAQCVEDSTAFTWTVTLPSDSVIFKWNTSACPVTALGEDVTSGLATYWGECLDGTGAPNQEIYNLEPADIPIITGFLFITYASGYIAGLTIHAVRRMTEIAF